ncbi:phosphate-starvation-inducible PsiE family protein [Methylocaldum sp. GT1TLB]|uniref:phosphate-starvation-inducible PsiE family protein n=1 Tax=Methylocaldum sp. GT1TLB TaxID=3438965 RepID=UPI003DA01E0E
MQISNRWKATKEEWAILSYYQRFESLVAFVLTIVIGLTILVALYQLTTDVVLGLVRGVLDPFNHDVFQKIFGEIMTLLIALEFNHTLQYVVRREQSIVQTKVVVLIALLAVVRKFIILEVQDVSAGHLLGLAAITLVLGLTYWLIREAV